MAEQQSQDDQGKKNWFVNFFSLGEVGGYFFRKKNKEAPTNVNIKIMHGINRIAIIVFLLGIIYLVLKHLL